MKPIILNIQVAIRGIDQKLNDVSGKLKVLFMILVIGLAFFAGAYLLTHTAVQFPEAQAKTDTLNIVVQPEDVKLAPKQVQDFYAYALNGTAPYTFYWEHQLWYSDTEHTNRTYFGNTNSTPFAFKDVTKYAILYCTVTDVEGSVGYDTVIVYDPAAFTISSGIYPGAPSFTVWEESGTYYAKTDYGVTAYSGTDLDTVVENSISATTAGSIVLQELQFNYSITIPENVMLIEQLGGVQRKFINVADSQGSPYTVSTDDTYYFTQDSAGSYINSYTGTDATTILNNAFAEGGEIYVKDGIYSLTASLSLASNTILKGESRGGTILYLSDGSDATVLVGSSITNVNVQNIQIDGNKAGQSSAGHGINFAGVSNYKIENVYVKNSYLDGIYVTGCSNGTITQNRIELSEQNGIRVYNSNDVHVTNNDISNVGNGYTAISIHNSLYNIVSENSVSGVGTTSGRGIHIRDHANFTVVSSNTVKLTGSEGIFIDESEACAVVGNIVRYAGHDGILVDGSPASTDTNFTTVSANIIQYAGWNAIHLANKGSQNTVMGNTILNPSQVAGSHYGILISGATNTRNSTHNAIISNTILSNDGSGMGYGIYDNGNAGNDYNIIIGNTVLGGVSGQISMSGANNVEEHNITS